MQFTVANRNSISHVITQTRSRVFQTVLRAFEVLRENQKLGLEFEMLARVSKKLGRMFALQYGHAAPVSHGNIYTTF